MCSRGFVDPSGNVVEKSGTAGGDVEAEGEEVEREDEEKEESRKSNDYALMLPSPAKRAIAYVPEPK